VEAAVIWAFQPGWSARRQAISKINYWLHCTLILLIGYKLKLELFELPFEYFCVANNLWRNFMAIGSSIVGTWNIFVDWKDTGSPTVGYPLTFNSDGTWTYAAGGGRWIQMEGMCLFNFTDAPGLIYSANVTRDTLCGIMGYPVAGNGRHPTGVWWGTRPGAPHLAAAHEAELAKKGEHDRMLGPGEEVN
jgi:hypothetical protein